MIGLYLFLLFGQHDADLTAAGCAPDGTACWFGEDADGSRLKFVRANLLPEIYMKTDQGYRVWTVTNANAGLPAECRVLDENAPTCSLWCADGKLVVNFRCKREGISEPEG